MASPASRKREVSPVAVVSPEPPSGDIGMSEPNPSDLRAGGPFVEFFNDYPPGKLVELQNRLNSPHLREQLEIVIEEIRAGMEEWNAWLESAENLPGITLPVVS
jgi:hypothetical protein